VLAASGSALADINTGAATPGAGELFFNVWSSSLGQSYTRDLGININNFLSSSTSRPTDGAAGNGVDFANGAAITYETGSVLAAGYRLVFGTDSALLSSLLSAGDAIWSVVGVRSFGSPDRMVTTSNAPISFTNGANAVATTTTWLGAVNSEMPGTSAADNNSITAVTGDANYAGSTSFNVNFGNNTNTFTPWAAVGTDLSFWEMSVATGGAPSTSQFASAFWSLGTDGVLSYEVAAIPAPGGLVLLLSGLLGLVGVARRRSPAAA
jgi:hypothetical protein